MVLHRPGFATIQAAGLPVLKGLAAIHRVIIDGVLEPRDLKACDEFIAPLPQAVVRWPAAVPAGLIEDRDVLFRRGLYARYHGLGSAWRTDHEMSIRGVCGVGAQANKGQEKEAPLEAGNAVEKGGDGHGNERGEF